jgi:DNA modification methylase
MNWLNKCHFGDCIETMRSMPDGIVQTCVTSPPYFGLRDYGHDGQIGLEPTPAEFVAKLVEVFREVRRVLKDDGTLWLNLGDTYNNNPSTSSIPRAEQGNGSGAFQIPPEKHMQANRAKANKAQPLIDAGIKKKDLIGIPWRVAFALQADGWYLRQDIIWHKPNPMPESVTDRCTKAHEYIFLLSKSATYYFDAGSIKEPAVKGGMKAGYAGHAGRETRAQSMGRVASGNEAKDEAVFNAEDRNKRSVWTVNGAPFPGAHFATFPTALIEPCILAGAPAGGVVLDPFFGSGTTGQVAQNLGRAFIGCELNTEYKSLQDARLAQMGLMLEAA